MPTGPTAPDFDFPPLPLDAWQDSKETLHLFLQIIGKIRLRLHPKLNHWWHVALYPSPRGFTTGRVPYGGLEFEILFDMIDHRVAVQTSVGGVGGFAVPGLSVAAFYRTLLATLSDLGIAVHILAHPYDHKSKVPFAEDTVERRYDPEYVARFWRIASQIASILEEVRGRFLGKATPVHLFWHSFDLAYTRFSGRSAPPLRGRNPSDREAYSHEVISVGFWAGDDRLREPAFYAYAYPEPEGLADHPLTPDAARWVDQGGSSMAILTYDAMRSLPAPRAGLLDFAESTYRAAATLGRWPTAELDVSG